MANLNFGLGTDFKKLWEQKKEGGDQHIQDVYFLGAPLGALIIQISYVNSLNKLLQLVFEA